MRGKKFKKKIVSLMLSCAMSLSIVSAGVLSIDIKATEQTPYEKYGDIQVKRIASNNTAGYISTLCDSAGNPVQLEGMSTYGIQWNSGAWIFNDNAFDALAYDWKCDVIRLAMYVAEGGYATDPSTCLSRVEDGIRLATERGMYVIVDWHILSPGNPTNTDYLNAGKNLPQYAEIRAAHPEYTGPQLFFAYLSQKYGSQGNVLFETANEPNGNGGNAWTDTLLPYHQSVVNAIREYDSDDTANIVICGTEQWSQIVTDPIGHEVEDSSHQIMYTVHFYAGSHDVPGQSNYIKDMITNALNNGLAIFCTECGTSLASGDGGPYLDYMTIWLDFFDQNNISWCAWSLGRINEVSAACLSTTPTRPTDNNGDGIPDWTSTQLSATGNYLKERISGTPASGGSGSSGGTGDAAGLILDFETSNQFSTFAVDSGSTNKDISIEAVQIGSNTVAQISGVNNAGIWSNRFAFKELSTVYGTSKYLTFEIYMPTNSVSSITLQPVIQTATNGWWDDSVAQQTITASQFVDQGNGYSKAFVAFDITSTISSASDSLGHILFLASAGTTFCLDNISLSNSNTPEATNTPKPTNTVAPTATSTPVPTNTVAPTATSTPVPTNTVAPTATSTPVPTNTVAPTATSTPVPTNTVAPTATSTPVPTNTVAPTVTSTPVTTNTVAPTVTSTPVPTNTVAPTVTSTPVPTNTVAPTVTSTPVPTNTVAPTPTETPEEGLNSFVDRLYLMVLGRNADEAGKAYWNDCIRKYGSTGADLARGFLESPEFIEAERSDSEFVRILYRVFFDREAADSEVSFWVDSMNINNSTKKDVITGFINSTEWANICLSYGIRSGGTGVPTIEITPNDNVIEFATRLYTTCLNRDADEAGVDYWAYQLANMKISGSTAASSFFFCDEFLNSDIDNDEYVVRLYRTFMGREAEASEIAYWVNNLTVNGATRNQVFQGFANSDEFRDICADYGILR